MTHFLELITDAVNAFIGIKIPGLGLPWFVVALVLTGVFLTIRMGFIQFRRLGHAFRIVRGDYDKPGEKGDISHFQALSTALSATVGTGNIAGVALAIHFGGPGAIFWMWVTALVGMCTKYTEVSLAMKHRDFDAKGNASGGPHKYILKGLGKQFGPLAVFFAVFAIICSFATGNMAQTNTLATAVSDSMGVEPWVTGIVAAILVGGVILGGITRIGRVTSILAPGMAIVYVTGAMIVLALNFDQIGGAFGAIFSNAFNPVSGFAGTAAGALTTTLAYGVQRGLFSNEAGQGSAPIAHSAARTDEPLSEGLVALLEPFIDTILICTMTALVILTANIWDKPEPEIDLLNDTNLTVMTWVENEPITLASFGEQMGRNEEDGKSRLETVGQRPATTEDDADKTEDVTETLVIGADGSLQARHHDGSLTPAILVKSNAPVFLDQDGEGIFMVADDGTRSRFAGEVPVTKGRIAIPDELKAAKTKLEVEGRMIRLGAPLTVRAFEKSLGPTGAWIVTLTIMLFTISTAISWSYYGDRATEFLFGVRGVIAYRLLFLGFVYLGAVLPVQAVWHFGDVALALMTLPNLLAILTLHGSVRRMQREYFANPPQSQR